MSDTTAVSMLIPVFNSMRYLERCWNSAIGQALGCLEILFIDDGSSDGSREWLQEAIEKDGGSHAVRLICHDRNRGVAAARNTALAHARGEYVFFVDADDWLDSDALCRMYERAKTNGADIVGCDQVLHFATHEQLVHIPLCDSGIENVNALFENRVVGGLSHVLVKRELYEKADAFFIEGADYAEDMQAKVKLFLTTDAYAYLPIPFYHYDQMNMSSVSHGDTMKKVEGRYKNVLSMIATLTRHTVPSFAGPVRTFKAEARLHAIRLYYEFRRKEYDPHMVFPEASTWTNIIRCKASRRYKAMLLLDKLRCGWLIKAVWALPLLIIGK